MFPEHVTCQVPSSGPRRRKINDLEPVYGIEKVRDQGVDMTPLLGWNVPTLLIYSVKYLPSILSRTTSVFTLYKRLYKLVISKILLIKFSVKSFYLTRELINYETPSIQDTNLFSVTHSQSRKRIPNLNLKIVVCMFPM